MALLHALHQLSKVEGWRLSIAHLNHQLRGRSSDLDEHLVRDTAKKLELPFLSERIKVRDVAAKRKISLEMAAREIRHEFLAHAAHQTGAKTVALAHHLDDQVELFFLRLLRGSGGEGLAGMKWLAPSPANPKVTLLRPLLNISKSNIEEYALQNRIPFRLDATNESSDFLRNRIRNELLPLLKKKYQPAIARTVSRTMEIIGAESDFVSQEACAWLESRRRQPFEGLPLALQRRYIQVQLQRIGLAAEFDLVEHLRLKPETQIEIDQKTCVARTPLGVVQATLSPKPVAFSKISKKIQLDRATGVTVFDGVKIAWKIQHKAGTNRPERRTGTEFFDLDKVGQRVVLRHWQPGDRFQPSGMAKPVKLQDFFTNQKIPAIQRRGLTIAVASNGEVFWVEGLRIADRFKLSKTTIRRLHWRSQRL
jgi:tRNA(Ile)-lysidine synthase